MLYENERIIWERQFNDVSDWILSLSLEEQDRIVKGWYETLADEGQVVSKMTLTTLFEECNWSDEEIMEVAVQCTEDLYSYNFLYLSRTDETLLYVCKFLEEIEDDREI